MTPNCPACGAKFSFDKNLLRCKVCLCPAEVTESGPEAIATWRQQTDENKRLFGRVHARVAHVEQGKPARQGKRRNKHGRRGVVVAIDEVQPWLASVKRVRKEQRARA